MRNNSTIAKQIFFCLLFLMNLSFTLPDAHSIDKNKWIPEDFNPANGILLIQDHPFGERQNNRMIEFLEKEYKWPYEIVTIDQAQKNEKYKDLKKYRFFMLWTDIRSREITTDPHGFTYNDIDGHFLDRNTNIEYPQSKHGKGYGQIGYRKVFNALNKAFKDQ